MYIQSSIDFTKVVHVRENSAKNERHLNENRFHFTGQCAVVLSLLQKGQVLSTAKALTEWHIGDLRRRIKDLKDAPTPVPIEEAFLKDSSGKRTRYKVWFIREYVTPEKMMEYGIESTVV